MLEKKIQKTAKFIDNEEENIEQYSIKEEDQEENEEDIEQEVGIEDNKTKDSSDNQLLLEFNTPNDQNQTNQDNEPKQINETVLLPSHSQNITSITPQVKNSKQVFIPDNQNSLKFGNISMLFSKTDPVKQELSTNKEQTEKKTIQLTMMQIQEKKREERGKVLR
ncbi:MAG: hypothetical protein EZS28_032912 [Streblomastix strix]|uniref:Uncharacterized protein n=1 Tax=Streblomastix strix TaxID=222440 RepID=A0A5J4UND8_9EUKA|nr:MAG: hypothetical protein EZS28_032912 [Streblomastix strix]